MTTRIKILLLIGLLLIGATQGFFGGLEPDDSDIVAVQQNSGLVASHRSSQVLHASSGFSLPSSKESVKLATPRNIFATLKAQLAPKKSKPVPRRPPSKTKTKTPVVARPVAPKPVQPTGPTPEQMAKRQEDRARMKAELEMNKYRFLGYLQRAGEQHVFLSNGQALYIVKQGEVVEGAIKLKTIEDTSVVLSKILTGMGATAEATLQLTKDEKGT
ncbi:MAG: hypothetical protein VST68_05350 [Nitrospirota bacterium]|nr:hypothetical protein [Nitrospirota bacterium]